MHFLASQLVSSRTKVLKCFQLLWDRSVDGHVTGQSNSRRFTNLSLTILYLYKEHQDVLLQQNVDYTFTKKVMIYHSHAFDTKKLNFFWWRSHSFTSSHNKNIGFGTKPNRLLDSIFTSRASNFSYRNTLQKSCFHASSHISALHDDYYAVNNSLPQKTWILALKLQHFVGDLQTMRIIICVENSLKLGHPHGPHFLAFSAWKSLK